MTTIYLVEEIWFDVQRLLAAYDDPHVAVEHAQHRQTAKEHGSKNICVREIGVRSRLQFKQPHDRTIFEGGKLLIELPPKTIPYFDKTIKPHGKIIQKPVGGTPIVPDRTITPCDTHSCPYEACWARRTQFAGSHYFCDADAYREPDFLRPDTIWELLPGIPCSPERMLNRATDFIAQLKHLPRFSAMLGQLKRINPTYHQIIASLLERP